VPLRFGREVQALLLPEGLHLPVDDETDEVVRAVPLNHEARTELKAAMEVQRQKFVAKFGREPGPDDPIFFDVDEDKVREDPLCQRD
jgi:hypothetical protein